MSTDRHDPLDADERELARVLRVLPAGEPPSALDARILAMARDAVVTTPAQEDEAQPRAGRAPRVTWGLGVAASCVLAAGLVWRMGGFGTEAFNLVGTELREDMRAPAPSTKPMVQPATPLPPAADEHISVEIRVPATPARTIAPPPPPLEEAPAPQVAVASTPAAPAPTGFAGADAAAESATLDRISVFGSRVSDAGAVAVIAEDSRAGPQAWIQRIRARIERGDTEGARQSLQGFIESYPGKPLPPDLIDFGEAAGVDDLARER